MGLMCSVGRVRPAHARYKDLNVFNARSRATHVRGHVRGVWFAMYRSRVEHVFRVHRHFRFDRLSHFSCTWALPDAPMLQRLTASPRRAEVTGVRCGEPVLRERPADTSPRHQRRHDELALSPSRRMQAGRWWVRRHGSHGMRLYLNLPGYDPMHSLSKAVACAGSNASGGSCRSHGSQQLGAAPADAGFSDTRWGYLLRRATLSAFWLA